MDGYQFIAAIFQSLISLAWPAALVVCVLLFREKLNALLPLLRMKYKDLDISFRLDKAEEEAAALPPPPPDVAVPSEPTPEEESRFEQIAEISPRAAIVDLRRELEQAVVAAAEQHGLQGSPSKQLTLATATRLLRNNGIINYPPHNVWWKLSFNARNFSTLKELRCSREPLWLSPLSF